MNIKASNGCWLTQKEEVAITERLFVKELTVTTVEEASAWIEITDNEKKEMEAQEAFFNIDHVDMNYLHKMDNVLDDVTNLINDAELTNNESLEMQKYYPRWDNIQGKQVFAGYRFNCDGVLYEALEPHTITEDKRPSREPEPEPAPEPEPIPSEAPKAAPRMMRAAVASTDVDPTPEPEPKHNYYKEVLPDLYKNKNVEQLKK